eukprot:10926124-Lingulodinium_polyedra.AAC.1
MLSHVRDLQRRLFQSSCKAPADLRQICCGNWRGRARASCSSMLLSGECAACRLCRSMLAMRT